MSLFFLIQAAHPPKVGRPDLESSGGLMTKLILSKFAMLGIEFSSMPASVTRTKSELLVTASELSSNSLLPLEIEPWALAYVALMDLELDMGSAMHDLLPGPSV